MRSSSFGRRTRWTASAAALAVVGGVLAGTVIASAAPAAPALPKLTPAQLLAHIQRAKAPSAMSGSIAVNPNLGLPSLPDNLSSLVPSSAAQALSLLTTSHTINFWYARPDQLRIAIPVSFGETDLRVNGQQVWLWQSHSQTATHIMPGAGPAAIRAKAQLVPAPVPPGKIKRLRLKVGPPPMPAAGQAALSLTPIQIAQKLLAAVGPTTAVSIAGSTTVANRSAYQLVIAPRSSQSLIGKIQIAVDAQTYLPLQVQILPRGSGTPAFSVGFTSFVPGRPAASNFTFTPPPGANVKTIRVPAGIGGGILPILPGPVACGSGSAYAQIAPVPPGALAPVDNPNKFAKTVKVSPARLRILQRQIFRAARIAGKPVRVAMLKSGVIKITRGGVTKIIRIGAGAKPPVIIAGPGGPQRMFAACPPAAMAGGGPNVMGSGWLSTLVLPVGIHQGWSGYAPTAPASPATSTAPPGSPMAGLGLLLHATTAVHGKWGSGRLLRTSLFSVLITNNGQLLIGAVTPAVLFADAAKAK